MRPRFQHVLIPIDLTSGSHPPIDVGLELAKVNEARVTLLHVVESLDSVAADEDIQHFLERCRQKADAELERRAQLFESVGLTVEFKTRQGHCPGEIVRYAEEHGVDLIIIGSHPLDPSRPVESLKALSNQVSFLARCSVLLVKNHAHEQESSSVSPK